MKRHFLAVMVSGLVALGACSSDDSTGGEGASGGAAASGGSDTSGGANSGDGATGSTSGGSTSGDSASGSSGSSSSSSGGSSGGTRGDGLPDAECVNPGDVNLDCPLLVGPTDGSCAPKGECCHRASNNAKIAELGPDEPAQIEYRLNLVDVYNHPLTIGNPVLASAAQSRADICAGEQCLLWRFTVPRSGGEFTAGPAKLQIGIGAYNCDGTYSYYGPDAAPARDGISDDPGRWQAPVVDADFDPTKEGIDQFHIPFPTNKNRDIARSIFLDTADNSIDWELASSGFEITEWDSSEAGRDCIGQRLPFEWVTGGTFVSYSPIKGNDVDVNNLINQTYCQLLGFGILPEGMKDLSCTETPRCVPGSEDCVWLKLPDSLCPENDAERELFGCHLGAEGNINGEDGYPESLNCTAEAPTAPLDPDTGATSDGQCCDPLGQSDTLPACNAYRTLQKYVAAAAEITDDPRSDIPPLCD